MNHEGTCVTCGNYTALNSDNECVDCAMIIEDALKQYSYDEAIGELDEMDLDAVKNLGKEELESLRGLFEEDYDE